ncbi:riboflavin kinase, partial [Flavobacterium sp.]
FVRSEIKFNDIEQLKNQIKLDAIKAKNYFNN